MIENNPIHHSLFLKAIRKEAIPRTPAWIMRQAGRYLPEYRKTRARAGDFLSLCKTPELACEVTLQPLQRFTLDAAIVFSDILTIPDAMQLGLSFQDGEGPVFERPLRSPTDIQALPQTPLLEELDYVMQAIKLVRHSMPAHIPLIGFSGSPWTLACYMIEGKSSKDFKQTLQLLYNDPQSMHALLNCLKIQINAYLEAQINAGANAIMLFDTWGGILTPQNYQHFSLFYMKEIIQHLKRMHPTTPIILFTKGGGQWLEEIALSGCDVLGLDWTTDLKQARQRVGQKVALQGNLDPSVLLSSPSCIRAQVQQMLASYGAGSGHIANLGHGITPDVPPEHVEVFLQALQEFSPAYHPAKDAL
ncbi:MAG: uroporphyrinogen decarboxylase [Legionellaceae bacterium]|nr:uroporphyrinogen decarboxylase [Legionellaceae bacterium]